MVLERAVQKIAKGKYESYKATEQKWAELEKRLGGFPTKCHYYMISGPMSMGTLIWQREWPDMATMEAAYNRMFNEPEIQALTSDDVIEDEMREIYFVEEY